MSKQTQPCTAYRRLGDSQSFVLISSILAAPLLPRGVALSPYFTDFKSPLALPKAQRLSVCETEHLDSLRPLLEDCVISPTYRGGDNDFHVFLLRHGDFEPDWTLIQIETILQRADVEEKGLVQGFGVVKPMKTG